DLRTPLTRLRTQLHRLHQLGGGDEQKTSLIERCIDDVDALLARFRALLRLSELEDLSRHSGFDKVDPRETLQRVHELYAPLAEEKGIALALETEPLRPVSADAPLLFEALSNLVDNAIKFTPAQGRVTLRARVEPSGTRIDVLDSGPGIPSNERDA